MNIFCDLHHGGLHRSLQLLLEYRLGHTLYRPIGMEWFEQGFWRINNQEDTARQFLSLDQAYRPSDGSRQLNRFVNPSTVDAEAGLYACAAAGGDSYHRACTLRFFKNTHFDIVIASIPQHVQPFKRLISLYQPHAKLIFQAGNEWDLPNSIPVMASLKRRPHRGPIFWYHQEIDLEHYKWQPHSFAIATSFVNILNTNPGSPFYELERRVDRLVWRSYGGQCRDGALDGDRAVGAAMRDSAFIFHVKLGGDGFGHVLHAAYACGRPVITRYSDYVNKLGEDLLIEGTFIDIERNGLDVAARRINQLLDDQSTLSEMSWACRQHFEKVVDYNAESQAFAQWLSTL